MSVNARVQYMKQLCCWYKVVSSFRMINDYASRVTFDHFFKRSSYWNCVTDGVCYNITTIALNNKFE